MLKTCYSNGVQTVGIAGSSNTIISSFWSREIQAVTLVDETSRAMTTAGPFIPGNRHKLHSFVVIAFSTESIKQTLQVIRNSLWWNHMASFLIIDSPTPLDHGCSKAFKILSNAWKMNLLYAKFLCHHESKGPLIYSYNPYTNEAPHPWQLEKTYRIKNKHPWTLLVRRYEDSEEICKDLDYDKAKDLGGYEIRGSTYSIDMDIHSSKHDLESIIGFSGVYARYLFRALNSTAKIFVYDSSIEISDMLRDISDIHLSVWYQQNDLNASMTYPYGVSGWECITMPRGQLSQIGKLLHVLDYSSRFAVVTVFFVTFIFFQFFCQLSVTSAFMNIVRLISNAAVPNLPNNVGTRIYLSCLFLFMLTLQAIYQGKLASLLTKQKALPNIDTLEDLVDFNYTIYAYKGLGPSLKKFNYSGLFEPLKNFSCEEYVLRNARAACVKEWSRAIDSAAKLSLYPSKDKLIKVFLVYLIRDDWPIEERLNTIISRLFEANILEYVHMTEPGLTISKLKYNEEEKANQKFEVITLKELAFAFAFLGIGLAFSTVVFIVEVSVSYMRGSREGLGGGGVQSNKDKPTQAKQPKHVNPSKRTQAN